MKVDAMGAVQRMDDIGNKLNPIDAGATWEETKNPEMPKPADTSTEALSGRANRSVEQLRKEFAESQKQQNEWRDRIVKMNMARAADAVPDDEARINALARQFNAPPEMVRNYRQLFEAQARDQKLSELPVAHPKTTDFLSDPNNARIAHDDIDNLSKSEDVIDSIVAYPRAFSAGIVRDFLGNRMKGVTERILASNYTTRMMQDVYTGSIGMTDDRLVGDWGDIDMSEYKAMRNVIMSPAQAVIEAGNLVDAPEEQKTFSVKVFGGLGQVAAQIASGIVEGPIGQLQALFDQGVGAVSDDILKDVEKAKKEGRTIDFPSRLAATLGGGVATAITEKASLELLGSPIANRIANRAARFAARTLVGGLSEGSQEVAESGLQTFIRRQLTNPDAKYQTGAEMFEEFTVAGTVGAIVANMLGLRRFRIGQATEKGIKALNGTAKASQLRGRDKQVYKTLVSTQTEGTPLENAYINTETWQTYFQQQGLDPKEQAERYGVTNYDEAATTGTDLTIPFPEYQSDFSASDHAPYFLRDTKLSEKGMTVNERETYLQRLEEQARETEELLERIGKESENARAVNDILSELTDEFSVQLESRYDKKTARTQATIAARAFMNPVQRDIVERAREEGKELSPDDIAGGIRDRFVRYGLAVNANAIPTTVNSRKNIDPAIDSQLEKLRRNELPKERDVYGQSLMEYIKEKGGLRPDDVTRDLVKNRQLPRSILNEKGMGADEFAALQEVLDFGIGNEQTQGDNALLDALVNEYTTGEKRYSNAQLNNELLSEAQALNDLSNDLKSAGIDLTTNTDNAAIREALSEYYEAQYGKNTREESQTSEADRYEQRGFTESAEPSAEERAEANRQYDEIIAKYKGTDQWMKAPNGQPTKLTERQWIQVRTPNFKRWLGFDWERESEAEGFLRALRDPLGNVKGTEGRPVSADPGLDESHSEVGALVHEIRSALSKRDLGRTRELQQRAGRLLGRLALLDPGTGEPQVFYHGSKADIEAFDLNHPNKKDRGWLGKGVYLTNDAFYADEYARNKRGDAGQNIMPLFASMKNPYITSINEKAKLGINTDEQAEKRTAELIEQGYDGIVAYDFNQPDWIDTKEVAVFSPEQVKSAVGNIGTFTDNPNILYQFIGEKGATALDRAQEATIRLDNLSIAREMETVGKEAKTIKLATGWERGADGKWRYEIDDSISVFKPANGWSKLFGERTFTANLEDVLRHELLFAAYPELRKMKIMASDMLPENTTGAVGYTADGEKVLVIQPVDIEKIASGPKMLQDVYIGRYKRIILHEVQHVIQDMEGFATGGRTEEIYSRLKEKLDRGISTLYKYMSEPDYAEHQRLALDYLSGKKLSEQEIGKLHELEKSEVVRNAVNEKKNIYETFTKEIDVFPEPVSELVNKIYSRDDPLWKEAEDSIRRYAYKFYNRISGEVEARNVEMRRDFTHEERLKLLGLQTEDVARKDQIFLYQSFKNGKEGKIRGATIINPDRTMRIELFKDANYSTFVHESAHFMLEVYGDLASDPEASTYIKNEYTTIRKYLGAKEGKPITREQHEKFARSFEAYLMEGKAPSPELQGIFSRFKTWLFNIYRTLKGLDVKLNKDIREVFDRMLASDEEIAIMRDASELQPLFATAEMMGIAQDEFDAYRKMGDSELTKAQDLLRQKVMKAKLREKTAEYKDELEQEKKRVAKEYDRDPVVVAFNDLTSGTDFSLNEAELQRVYGKSFLSRLPKRNGNRIYSKGGQISLEDFAESLDFSSGDALIRAIAQLPNRQEYIHDKARANLLEREGDVLNSNTVADEAENALHNEYMEARLKKELAILNRLKKVGKAAKASEKKSRIEQRKEARRIEEDVAAQMDAMKVAAVSIIAGKKVKDVKPHLYLRAMQSASRKARQALNKTNPDYTAAARQKQAEIMNNLLYREATRVQQEVNKRTLQAKAIARKPIKNAIKTRDSLGINKAKYIAAKIGLDGDPDTIMQRIRTEEKNRDTGDVFAYDIAGPLSELDTATALDVLEDIKANWDQARRDKVMIIDGKRVEIDRAAEEVSGTLRNFGKTWRSQSKQDTIRNSLLKRIGNIILDQTRLESWCDMVDGKRVGEETGAWMRNVFNPVKQAGDQSRLAQADYTKKLTNIIDGFGFTRETIAAPELNYTFGADTGYGKAELIHAMLHTGNMSNLQRLIVGHGWGTIQNGQIDTRRWNAFMSRMIAEGRITEQDFDRVQQIWDLFDELKPKSQQAYKEVFGRYFDEITAAPFFEFGKRYNGGYIPAIYDSRKSKAGEKQLDPVRELINEMGYALPKPVAGWGNSRVEGNHGPLLLDLSALRTHINKQILFAYLAPVNKDVSNLLNKKNVQDALREYDPEFFSKVMKPWLSRAITQNLEATGKQPTPYDGVARTLRTRAGVSAMFGNVVNAAEQIFDMTAAYAKVKPRYLTDAFKTMVSDHAGTVQAVMEASPYMRGRMNAEIMAANGRFEQVLRPGKLRKLDRWVIDHAYFLQASVDNFCGPLTWTAAYNQATEAGLSHSEAVAQADSVVRQVFGANAAEDISNFEGGAPLKRMFTQFTGYFVQRANLIAGEYSKIQRSDIANKKAAAAILLLQTVLLPAWIGAALRKIASGSDDDDTFGSWLMDIFGWGSLNYGLSMGGHAGQIANAAIDRYRGKSFASGRVFYPPAIKMIEDAFKFRKWENSSGDFDVSKFVQDMAEIERVVPGLPIIPARPVATARYVYEVATDEVEPTSEYDFVRGMVTGRASADSRQ